MMNFMRGSMLRQVQSSSLRFSRLGFRNATTATASVRPPIQLHGLDGVYATSLYTAAVKESKLDRVEKALTTLGATLKERPEFAQFIANPSINYEDKKLIVSSLSKMTGGDALLSNFFNILSVNNRLSMLDRIENQFQKIMRVQRGEVEVTITSAAPLDSKTLSRLESKIAKSKYGKGKLLVSNKVSPSILGGLIVEIGDNILDVSISSRVNHLNKLMTDAI
ncbi:F0-ATPase delta subunit [Schizosaccharomyces cryophilus OY26]|uniref:ATP synthase subunit 5, mitochondrial n=1 Tax=Schizosaccharomyces cryophilus (strain OY26 / ATCC MYA-4695 / CBS 11777 / NBRC 106824 / NRRL Y48691) TaxID=653667 RepID=S9X230_SCHCR|nr:F0-ATPase delta subunit [Schizosaccharomyces cryophilus OY26]EPY51167.1 F0-ATPase delta subunit [Schizosaccharomyces cryophilus OY26]